MEPSLLYPLLFVAGAVSGTLNVLAGGGSFLTLPVLIFLGLPATTANGTNRVSILVQNTGAVWSFGRDRVINWDWLRSAALPALAGAAVGTWLAVRVGDASFQRILATLMVVFAAVTVWDPAGRLRSRGPGAGERPWGPHGPGFAAAFFAVGVYGGFVQAGIGFLILGVATVAGLDLVRGNALKVLVVLTFTPLALALFALADKVDWGMGLALGSGSFFGGLLGARLSVLKGHAWIRRVVLVVILAFALKLWIAP